MHTSTNYFIELLITGAGTAIAILLVSLGFWGIWIPFDVILVDSTLIGILILVFPLLYTIGIVTDRLVDNLYDRWFGDEIILTSFCTLRSDPKKLTKQEKITALRGYSRARSKIYLASDSLRQVFEYGRMRIRITRSWSYNSVLILLASQVMIWSPLVPAGSLGQRFGIAMFVAVLMLMSAIVAFRAWQVLVRKECGLLNMQSELIDEWRMLEK